MTCTHVDFATLLPALHTCIADMYTQILHRICYVLTDVTTWIKHIAWMLTCMYMWIEAIMVDMHTRELCYLVACTSTAMYTLTLLTRCFDADMYVHVVRGYG